MDHRTLTCKRLTRLGIQVQGPEAGHFGPWSGTAQVFKAPAPSAGVAKGYAPLKPALGGCLGSQIRNLRGALSVLVEDHGFVAVAEDAAVDVPSDGAGENHPLPIAATGYEVFNLVAVADAGGVLLDDRAVIEDLGDVVAGGADQLDSACVGGVIGPRSGERRQERVMHIDDGGGIVRDELRRQNLHVARQDNK